MCDGPAPPPAPPLGGGASSSSHESCVLSVESLECSIAELRSLKVEIEAQTWSVVGSQDDSGKNNFRFFLVVLAGVCILGGGRLWWASVFR